jgi:hypothetical protein
LGDLQKITGKEGNRGNLKPLIFLDSHIIVVGVNQESLG